MLASDQSLDIHTISRPGNSFKFDEMSVGKDRLDNFGQFVSREQRIAKIESQQLVILFKEYSWRVRGIKK